MRSAFLTVMLASATVVGAHSEAAGQASDEALIAGAVMAAPTAARDGAEVRAWTEDGGLRVIREGTNDFVCLANRPGGERFQTTCYHNGLEPFLARGRELREEGLTGMAYQEARWAEADAGTLQMPEMAAVLNNFFLDDPDWDPLTGDEADGGRLNTVYMPYATPEATGIPTRAPQGHPWLMWPGKASSHIMIVISPASLQVREGDAPR